MLTSITHRIKGIFAWGFLITISVVFIFWGSIGLRLTTNKYVEVNGERVYPQEINSFKQVYPQADLVQVTLGMQELYKIGFKYSDEQLDNLMQELPLFQVNGAFSKELYNKYLSQNFQQLQAVRKGAEFNGLVQQMTYGLRQAQRVFPATTERYYKLMDQKRNISVLTIEQENFLKETKVTDEDLNNYYQQNKSQYVEPAKVQLEYIKLDYPDIVSQVKISKADIDDFYNENKQLFTKPGRKKVSQIVVDISQADAKQKLDQVQEALKNNMDFADIAKKFSDDKLTAKNGGDAGWFQQGDMGDATLDEALVNLANPGDISPAVTADNKWYIFKLIEQRPEQQLALKEVEADVKTKVAEQRANTVYAELKEQLELKSFEIADSLAIVAEELNLKTQKSAWLNSNGFIADDKASSKKSEQELSMAQELVNPKVLTAAFSEDVLENRNNSPVIELNSESLIVVRVNDYKAERIKDFSEVKSVITSTVKDLKSKKKAKEYAEKLWQDFINNTASIEKLETISKKDKYIKFEKPKAISYLDTFWAVGNDPNVKEEFASAFELPKPSEEYPLQAKLLSLDNGNQAILAVNKVTLGEYDKASDAQKSQTSNQLKYFMMMRDNANFFNRIYKNSDVRSYL